jgi:hypothetical protein
VTADGRTTVHLHPDDGPRLPPLIPTRKNGVKQRKGQTHLRARNARAFADGKLICLRALDLARTGLTRRWPAQAPWALPRIKRRRSMQHYGEVVTKKIRFQRVNAFARRKSDSGLFSI